MKGVSGGAWRLPPLNQLRAFEAAARHLSFSRAALELGVTHGAVSQQIRALEARLGQSLFRRLHRAVVLTPARQALLASTTAAFQRLDDGLGAPLGYEVAGRVTIGCPPSFASLWLVPRLPRLAARHPELQIEIVASQAFSLEPRDDVDLAIRTGPAAMPGLKLFDEWIVPVRARSTGAAERLLHDANAMGDWALWLAATGGRVEGAKRGPRFSHGLLTLQAAAAGLGVALARLPLSEETPLVGSLVAHARTPIPSGRVWFREQSSRSRGARLDAVDLWLQEEAAASTAALPAAWSRPDAAEDGTG